jgi:hypothetical protein
MTASVHNDSRRPQWQGYRYAHTSLDKAAALRRVAFVLKFTHLTE